jgi:hypothetical protein
VRRWAAAIRQYWDHAAGDREHIERTLREMFPAEGSWTAAGLAGAKRWARPIVLALFEIGRSDHRRLWSDDVARILRALSLTTTAKEFERERKGYLNDARVLRALYRPPARRASRQRERQRER